MVEILPPIFAGFGADFFSYKLEHFSSFDNVTTK